MSAAEHASIVALPTTTLSTQAPGPRRGDLPELVAQPERIRETLAANDDALDELATCSRGPAPTVSSSPGAGDSLAVAIAARQAFEQMTGGAVRAGAELDLAYYLAPIVTDRSVVIALSSSGETTRTVEAALVAQHVGALTVAITNTAGSTLDQESERTCSCARRGSAGRRSRRRRRSRSSSTSPPGSGCAWAVRARKPCVRHSRPRRTAWRRSSRTSHRSSPRSPSASTPAVPTCSRAPVRAGAARSSVPRR